MSVSLREKEKKEIQGNEFVQGRKPFFALEVLLLPEKEKTRLCPLRSCLPFNNGRYIFVEAKLKIGDPSTNLHIFATLLTGSPRRTFFFLKRPARD